MISRKNKTCIQKKTTDIQEEQTDIQEEKTDTQEETTDIQEGTTDLQKGREIGEKSCPTTHISGKTHKTHYKKKTSLFRKKKKAPKGYPSAIARGAGGPVPAQD